MYSKLHRPEKNAIGGSLNANSCVKLADYLNKETGDNKTFFSHQEDNVSLCEVINRIDNNKRTLKRKQDKFYMLSYNPSHREVVHLVKLTTGKDVKDLSELTDKERELVFSEFREYVRDCMNIYASNFNREKELGADDLVYFGRIEEFRHYTYQDEEVKSGSKKVGDLKEGINLHAHIIVSRMDVTQTISLSPLAKSMGNSNILNGKVVKNGFSMKDWQYECFEHFGNKYRYIASTDERFYNREVSYAKYKNRIKNKIVNDMMEDLAEERKALYNVKLASSIIHPSKKSINLYLKRKIKDILFDNESVI